MYTVTTVNFEGKKVSSEAFLNEEAAQKEWELCVEKYKAQSSNLEGEKTTKEIGGNGGKAWAYYHAGFCLHYFLYYKRIMRKSNKKDFKIAYIGALRLIGNNSVGEAWIE